MITINIYKNDKLMVKFEHEKDDFAALRWMLNNNSCSCNWALKYEGYKVELIDEETGEKDFWKHS